MTTPENVNEDMAYEAQYIKYLTIAHKSVIMLYSREKQSAAFARKIRPEVSKILLATEIKDANRLIEKYACTPDQPVGIDIIVADVDHSTLRLLEILKRRASNDKTSNMRSLPIILLMPESLENDIKQTINNMGIVDAFVPWPAADQSKLFCTVLEQLHRRHEVEDIYTDIRKQRKNIKYPYVAVFDDEPINNAASTSRVRDDALRHMISEAVEEDAFDTELDDWTDDQSVLPAFVFTMRERIKMQKLKKGIRFKGVMDGRERAAVDRDIMKELMKGKLIDYDSDDNSDSQSHDAEELRSKRTNPKTFVRVNSINLLSNQYRPRWKNSVPAKGSTASSTDANSSAAELLPFIQRTHPDLTKPHTVAGLPKKQATAAWRVLHLQNKFGPGHQVHKHDRPWAVKPKTDPKSTAVAPTVLVKRSAMVKDEAAQEEEAMNKEAAEKNKAQTLVSYLAAKKLEKLDSNTSLASSTPSLHRADSKSSTPSLHRADSKSSTGSRRPKSMMLRAVRTIGKMNEQPKPPSAGVLRVLTGWRGVAETGTHDDEGKKVVSLKSISKALREVGGVQFGNIVLGKKARVKARRLIRNIAANAVPDPETMRLMELKLENRRVGSGEREHIEMGLSHQANGNYLLAVKSFTRGIMLVKSAHIPTICRGIVQFLREKYFSALHDFTTAIDIMEKDVVVRNCSLNVDDMTIALFNRSLTHFRLGDDELGIVDLKSCLAISPNNIRVREMLMVAYRRMNNYAEATEQCVNLNALREKNISDEDIKSVVTHREANIEKKGHLSPHKLLTEEMRLEHLMRKGSAMVEAPAIQVGSSLEQESFAGVQPVKPLSLARRRSTSKSLHKSGTSMTLNKHGSLSSLHANRGDDSERCQPIKVIRVEVKDCTLPGLKEKKEQHQGNVVTEATEQNNMYLENFKHANGFAKGVFEKVFIRLSPLQEALVAVPSQRKNSHLSVITTTLRGFPLLSGANDPLLRDLASCIEYRTITTKSTIFAQGEPVDAVILVLTGKLQLRFDTGDQTQVISDLEEFDVFGDIDILFRKSTNPLVEHLIAVENNIDSKKQKPTGVSSGTSSCDSYDSGSGIDEDMFEEEPGQQLERSLRPHSFVACKVKEPCELLMVHYSDFDRLLYERATENFNSRLELFKCSGLFTGLLKEHELVRLVRMSFQRRYGQGAVILEQGQAPQYLYIVMKGICKVVKRPDPSENLVRKLEEMKTAVSRHDQQYAFHHRLKLSLTPASPEFKASTLRPHATQEEEWREQQKLEIARLESLAGKTVQMEQKRREEEAEMIKLGRPVPNSKVDIATLKWSQIFGEACLLAPESGTSLGTVLADTVSEVVLIHKSYLQTFKIDEKHLDRVRIRAVQYPSDEKLVEMLHVGNEWASYKAGIVEDIPKSKWPGYIEVAAEGFRV